MRRLGKISRKKRDGGIKMKKLEKIQLDLFRFCFRQGADRQAFLYEMYIVGAIFLITALILLPHQLKPLCVGFFFVGFVFYPLIQYSASKIMKSCSNGFNGILYMIARRYLLKVLAKRIKNGVIAKDLEEIIRSKSQATGFKIQAAIAKSFYEKRHYKKDYSENEGLVLDAFSYLFKKEDSDFIFLGSEKYILLSYYLKPGFLRHEFSYYVYGGFDKFISTLGDVLYAELMTARKEAALRMQIKHGEKAAPDLKYLARVRNLTNNNSPWTAQIVEAIKATALQHSNYRIVKDGLYAPIYGLMQRKD
jgi:hypothetical protein